MTQIQEIVARSEQAEKAERRERERIKAEANTGIEQMLIVLLFFACFGSGIFVAKVIEDFHGPLWAAVLTLAMSAGAFLVCLKRLGQK